MFYTNNIANGNGVNDIFAFDSYALRVADVQVLDMRRQRILYTPSVGIKGNYGAIRVNSGGIVPLVTPTNVLRGSAPLDWQPSFKTIPNWGLPQGKM